MKRRETESGHGDTAQRTALVRACSRWLSFARTLSRGRRRMAAADTLSFVESLYGEKFKAVEGGAFSLDKVYKTVGGGLSVSETRLHVSMHPRFDLRLLNVVDSRAGSQIFREALTTTALTLLSHSSVSGREQPLAARHHTNVDSRTFQGHSTTLYQTSSPVTLTLLRQRTHFGGPQTTALLHAASAHGDATPSPSVQTWNVLPAAERVSPAFGYVSVRGQRAQQAQGPESSRPRLHGDAMTSPSAETSRPLDASAPASVRLTSLDLRPPVLHALRQEFVSVLLNTYLPAAESRESVRTTGELAGVSPRRATVQDETERRFTPERGVAELQSPLQTYATPTTRQQPGGTVEIRREFRESRAAGTVQGHASARDPRPPLLQVLSPTSLLLSLSEEFLTVLAGGAGGAGHTTTYHLGERAPALSLQHLRTHTAPSGTREGAASVQASRLLAQAPRRAAGTREVLSSINTLVERVQSNFANITHAGNSTVFTRFGFEQVSARQRGASSGTAPGHATTRDLLGQTGEFVRPSSVAEFTREASTHDAGTQTALERAPGAGTFHFSSVLLRRSGGASTAGALTPTAAMAQRLAAAGETARATSEARAARPEGMALELIRHRREEVLHLPQPGYVFTQPARGQLEERQVITKASREEIVEVVRKEVRTLAASAPATAAASRAELAGIADEVYSTLVRRLLVEKERLGRA